MSHVQVDTMHDIDIAGSQQRGRTRILAGAAPCRLFAVAPVDAGDL
jgi:hypothetical protein